ncbi:lipase maturation factor family protein [Streptantibioticus silvisoli]|uniref:Lipase maturation factor family protein n=1 Tax=Streptantibioticus silvisoli TaxID=2705255 RepID=A0ABT6VUF5_9ACTN|nr:lipase maturation factor family protein [Streptantibioticus silvisoli]MDI5961795.1 lipase maturation factor family protein [Streptantibioticus silvisoli]
MEWFTVPGQQLGRLVFQRGLAAVYAVAFACCAAQFGALIGRHGMLPVPRFTARVPFRRAPSLFHLRYSDRLFASVAWGGTVLAAAVAGGAADAVPLWAATVMWALLWAAYLSVVNVGQVWYGFGWETLLLETGFLAVFLGNARCGPPVLTLWLLRWLLFRVEFGAGLIKLRGDRCWRDLTCLSYHHETQPMPGPLSWLFHRLPGPVHRVEAAANHVAQLVVPVLLFTPQPVAGTAAAVVVVTQLWLVASGNFAWLNWLTIVLALPTALAGPLSGALPDTGARPPAPGWFEALVIAVTALVAWRSAGPVRNMLSRRQLMNVSFDPLRLVNSYGAFGTVGRVRYEVVVEGTGEREVTAGTRWLEYGFRGKPGDPRRLPRQWAPYHLRLDWMMWFAALSPGPPGEWFTVFVRRLLEGDRATLRLLRSNPFPRTPPVYVRAVLYRYRFTTWAELRATGAWWSRTPVRVYLPPVGPRDRAGGDGGAGPAAAR